MTEYAQGGPVGGGGGFWLDGCTPRYIAHPAPDLSPAEAEIVARFEAAPTPPEIVEARVVEEVGQTVLNALLNLRTDKGPYSGEAALEVAAAVAAYRAAQDGGAEGQTCPCGRGRYIVDHAAWCPPAQDGGAEEAVRRVEALADELYDVARDYRHVPSGTHDAGARNAHMAIADRIYAALAPQASR